jgi:hypothetical protein
MDAVLCLRETTHFQSMELDRPEAICGLESGTRPRLWSTRGDCAFRQEVAFFGLRLAGTEIACPNQFSSAFSWLQICRHRGDHESNVCVVLTADATSHFCRRTRAFAQNPHKIIDVRCEMSVNNSRLVGQPEAIHKRAWRRSMAISSKPTSRPRSCEFGLDLTFWT